MKKGEKDVNKAMHRRRGYVRENRVKSGIDGFNATLLMRALVTAILLISVLAMLTAVASAAEQLYVNETGWYRTGGAFNASGTPIQHAIDNATEGDSIYVYNGSYTENVDVNKAHLTLQGEGRDVVTVTAEVTSDHVFEVTVDYVNISGFTATGAALSPYAGIYGRYTDYCNIFNNNASNNRRGIYLWDSRNNTLQSNTANLNTEYGIFLKAMYPHTTTYNNTLTGNNASSNGQIGIELCGSSNNTLTSNTANSNGDFRDWDCGIHVMYSNYNNLTNNTANVNKGAGIYVYESHNNNIMYNTANLNDNSQGIHMHYNSKYNTVTKNTLCSNYIGIMLHHYSNENNITCNWVQNNSWSGIHFYKSCEDNNVSYNNIIVNGAPQVDGSYHWQLSNDQYDDVDATHNYWGGMDNDTINASIYDWQDYPSKGNVTFLPKLSGPDPCAPISEAATIILFSIGLLVLAGYVWLRRRE